MRIVLAAMLLILPAQAQVQPPNRRPAPPALLSGVVQQASDGKPLKRATIILQDRERKSKPVSTASDDEGRFVFDQLKPGAYFLTVRRDGFLTTSTFLRGGVRQPAVLFIDSGQAINDVSVQLRHAGVILGKVRYEDGEPCLGAQVFLYRDEYLRGRRSLALVARVRTDFRGEYSIYGLTPGYYYAAAQYEAAVSPEGAVPQIRRDELGNVIGDQVQLFTFYPSTARLNQASPLLLRLGDQLPNVVISLLSGRTHRVQGRILSAASGKFTGARLSLYRVAIGSQGSIEIDGKPEINSEGYFDLKGVAPGDYELIAEGSEQEGLVSARVTFTISDSDIENVPVTMHARQRWRGQVSIVSEAKDEKIDVGHLQVSFEPRGPLGHPQLKPLSATGSFEVDLDPDETYDLYLLNLPPEYSIRRASSSGVDLLRDGFRLQAGGTGNRMSIVVARTKSGIQGRAIISDTQVAPGASVVLVPDFAGSRLQSYRGAYADEFGSFEIRGVAPGRYLLFAWTDEPPCDLYRPDITDVCGAQATRITVDEQKQTQALVRVATSP